MSLKLKLGLFLATVLKLLFGSESLLASEKILSNQSPAKIYGYGTKNDRPKNHLKLDDIAGKTYKIRSKSQASSLELNNLERFSGSIQNHTTAKSAHSLVLPNSRFQSSRWVEIFFLGIPIFDPVTGLAPISNLSIESFGEASYSVGISPYWLPSTNPVGSLSLTPIPIHIDKSSYRIHSGAAVGTYNSLKLLKNFKTSKGEHIGIRVYGSQKINQGSYDILDHRGTPYDSSDDKNLTIPNSVRSSRKFLPILSYRAKDWKILALMRQSSNASELTPPFEYSAKGNTFEGSDSFKGLSLERSVSEKVKLKAYAAENNNVIALKLKDNKNYTRSTQSHSNNKTQTFGFNAAWNDEYKSILFDASKSFFRSQGTKIQVLNGSKIESDKIYLGSLFSIKNLDIESAFRSSHRNVTRKEIATGSNIAFSYLLGKGKVVLILGEEEKMPALNYLLGNNRDIEANPELKNERIRLKELQLNKKFESIELQSSIYQYNNSNHISTIRTSFNKRKAFQISEVEFTGIDLNVSTLYSKKFQNSIAFSLVEAHDIQSGKKVPEVPSTICIVNNEYNGNGTLLGLSLRYNGEMYQDHLNKELWLPDWNAEIYFNQTFKISSSSSLHFGSKIINLRDQKSTYFIYNSEKEGRLPYSHVDGFPLPGRTLSLQIGMDF